MLRVFQAGSGTQDLTISGPLATPVYCEANARYDFAPRVIWLKPGCQMWQQLRGEFRGTRGEHSSGTASGCVFPEQGTFFQSR
eukprot:4604989-Pyramimonas_sp.AAC.1